MYSLPCPRLSRPLPPYLLSYFSVSNQFAQREWWSPCAWAVHSDNNLVELGNETIKEDDRLFYWNEENRSTLRTMFEFGAIPTYFYPLLLHSSKSPNEDPWILIRRACQKQNSSQNMER
ncbi:hypothetical protein CK203_046633 [Vitis vinifera]|uniref:Uncharacterized protein n=1 Tax=Vitis vinifera TaxID=29760 RepID=A0A438HLB2_VITVI|nr:hypothetical protein CK203_046633 [Vitis vinifera]